jgi:hypothetical protein
MRNSDQSRSGRLILEASMLHVARRKWPIEREPSDRARNVTRSAKNFSSAENAGADSRPYREKDRLGGSPR